MSFYVGDQETDFDKPFTLGFYGPTGTELAVFDSRLDRRYYSYDESFSNSTIGKVVFTPSADWELFDELSFVPTQ